MEGKQTKKGFPLEGHEWRKGEQRALWKKRAQEVHGIRG